MAPIVANTGGTSLVDLLFKGGWVMAPILLLSIVAFYAILERLITFYKMLRVPRLWLDNVNAQLIAGDFTNAQMLCEGKHYALANIIQEGIKKLKSPNSAFKVAVKNTAQQEVYKLERNVALLGTIANTAPMLGFLGTVIGMIQAFMAMAQQTQQVSPKLLSGGIYEAMITTAAGLIVGVIANLAYNYLLIRVQKATQRLEHNTNQFVELLETYSTH